MAGSARWALPFIESGQAQKEITHNEALALLDIAVQADVEAVGVDTPPAAPAIGQCWIVGATPVGAWVARPHRIAGWTEGGWRFVTARDGASAWDRTTRRPVVMVDGAWESGVIRAARLVVAGQQVVGTRRPAIADPQGGTSVDGEARAAVASILSTLRAHGLIAS